MEESLIDKPKEEGKFVVAKSASLLDDPSLNPVKKSIGWSFMVLLLVLPLWPFIKLCRVNHHVFTTLQYICFILTFIGVAYNVFPLCISLYIFIIYFGMVYAEFEAISNMAYEPTFCSFLKALIKFREWERLSHNAGIEPSTTGGVIKYVFVFIGVLLAFAASVGIAYFIQGSLTIENSIVAISTCSLGYILSRILRIIDLVYMIFSEQVAGKKVEMNAFFEKFDSASAVRTIDYYRTSADLCKKYKVMFLSIEFAQTFGFIYLIVIIAASFFVHLGGLTDFLNSDACRFTNVFMHRYLEKGFMIGYVFLLSILVGINLFTIIYKLKVSFYMNKIYDSNVEKFTKIEEQLTYMVKLPQMFISPRKQPGDTKNPKNDDVFTAEDIIVKCKSHQNVFRIDCPIAEILWKRIVEEEDVAKVSYRRLRELVVQYAQEILDQFEFIRKEYLDFYKGIEYKFMGFLKVDKALITKIAVTAGTSLSTFVIAFIKKNTTIPASGM